MIEDTYYFLNILLNNKSIFYFLGLLIVLSGIGIKFLAEQEAANVTIHQVARNNLWSHYSSKSLKSKLYEIEKNRLILSLQSNSEPKSETLINTLIANLDREILRYRKEQSDIQAEANRYDRLFETARRKHSIFSSAYSLIQASFALLVLAVLLRIKTLWPKIIFLILFLISILMTAYGILFI